MRCDQFAGLNEWAWNATQLPSTYKVESGATFTGMFGCKYPLFCYTFEDGRVFTEHVQASPWSSGPVFFLSLKDINGEWLAESLWAQHDLEEV